MHLYLRSADFTTEVPGIGLRDGCLPVIGTQPITTPDNDLRVEPAVWFKVQVIDAVSIDCIKRAILWNSATVFNGTLAQVCKTDSDTDSSAENGGEHNAVSERCDSAAAAVEEEGTKKLLRKGRSRVSGPKRMISESMYIGGECYGYQSDLDELFDTAQHLLLDYSQGKVSSTAMNDSIFQLLHCYILPAIKLTGDDLAKVIAAYKEQEDAVELVDSAIVEKHKEIEKLEGAMKTQREKHFLPNLCSGQPVNFDSEFAKTLQKHIHVDIRNAWEDVERLQDAVDQAKRKQDPEIAAMRTERERLLHRCEKLISCRETLHEVISCMEQKRKSSRIPESLRLKSRKVVNGRRKSKTGTAGLDPLQSVYLGMVQEVSQRLVELQTLAHKKVLVISVKEAMRMTMKELQSGDDTFGVHIDKTGRIKATDVLRHSSIPKAWQTLTETGV